jgi:hypothetical protein
MRNYAKQREIGALSAQLEAALYVNTSMTLLIVIQEVSSELSEAEYGRNFGTLLIY